MVRIGEKPHSAAPRALAMLQGRMRPSPAEQIQRLFAGPDADVDLARAALTLARIRYPGLEDGPTLRWLDARGRDAARRLAGADEPDVVISAISAVLFEECGFEGNRDDYYDPCNSFLNDVIERRTGIPITLSILYIEIAKRLGAPIYGIGLPMHFMVKYHDAPAAYLHRPLPRGASA